MNQPFSDIDVQHDQASAAALSVAPHILIVEDSPTQAERLRHALEQEGWTVTWAASVEPAWAEMSRRRPDLMIVDFHLPGMLGDEFCRRVRMNPPPSFC